MIDKFVKIWIDRSILFESKFKEYLKILRKPSSDKIILSL